MQEPQRTSVLRSSSHGDPSSLMCSASRPPCVLPTGHPLQISGVLSWPCPQASPLLSAPAGRSGGWGSTSSRWL